MFAEHRATLFGMADRRPPGDGVVVGQGTVMGRLVHLASQDFTVLGGSSGEVHAEKMVAAAQGSLQTGSPFVFINDSGGARVQEGIDSLHGCGRLFYHNVLLSGVVPQITIIAGPCAGARGILARADRLHHPDAAGHACSSPGPTSSSRSPARRSPTRSSAGPTCTGTRSGVVHFVADDDQQALLHRQEAADVPAVEQHRGPARGRARRQRRARTRRSTRIIPRRPAKAATTSAR